MKKTVIGLILFNIFYLVHSQVYILPEPEEISFSDGFFRISPRTVLEFSNNEDSASVEMFNHFLHEFSGFRLQSDVSPATTHRIRLQRDNAMEPESYRMNVGRKVITIRGSKAGILYGLQTLQQVIVNHYSLDIPCMTVNDSPRFPYRGMMLDVARYFYPVSDIKVLLDQMARYKLNTFHWHLTEDYGWRVEIKKYPELTRKGAWRKSTQTNKEPRRHNNVPHGGYYTQEEIREVVAYAAERNITVIPEIEMPGHSMAALAVFPHLSCTGGPFEIPVNWGIKEDIFCAGNEEVYTFLENVLNEIIDLFPSEYIHIGGDEAPKKRWKECPRCQRVIQREQLKNENELQGYFVSRIAEFLDKKGKKIIGWDEILEAGEIPGNAVVMSWRGTKGGVEAAKKGYDVIMAPNNLYYLDRYQTADISTEPHSIGGFVPLDSTYLFEPTQNIPDGQHHFVTGVQANLWMEYIHSMDLIEYMLYPRLLAVAEAGWAPGKKKNYSLFLDKMSHHLRWLDQQAILFRIPEPFGYKNVKENDDSFVLDLKPPVVGAQLYYSLDGSAPLTGGQLYETPIEIRRDANIEEIKCAIVLPSGRTSMDYTIQLTR